MQQTVRADFDASVMSTGRGIVRDVDIHEDRLYALERHAVIGGRQTERPVQREQNVGIPGSRFAGVLVVGDHPLAIELRGSGLLEDRGQLAVGEERLRDRDRNVLYRCVALDRDLKSDELVPGARQLDVRGPDWAGLKKRAGLRVNLVQLGERPYLHRALSA